MKQLPMDSFFPKNFTAAYRVIFSLLVSGFVLTGIVVTVIGQVLPYFIERWQLNDEQAGFFVATQFTGSLIGAVLSNVVLTRKGFRPALAAGYLLMGAGVAALNAGSREVALAACAAYGFGYGLGIPSANIWTGETAGERRGPVLTLLNLAWGAGALICPPLVNWAAHADKLTGMFYVVAAANIAIGIALAFAPFGTSGAPAKANEEEKPGTNIAGLAVAAGLGILFFVYVGTESSVSSWTPAHAKRLNGADSHWQLVTMAFWVGLLGGRAIASAVLLRVREGIVAATCLFIGIVGCAALLSAHSRAALFGGAFLAGLGLSSLYPIYIAWLSKWFGVRARKVGGVLFALASAGGAVMPWLVGEFSKISGSLRVGLLVPLAGCLVMLAVVLLLRRRAFS